MGTDIHGVVEKKVRLDGVDKWVAVNILRYDDKATDRNYERFAKLAGVRGEGPAPKGLPVDISESTRVIYDEECGHSASWLPLEDAVKIFNDTERRADEDTGKSFTAYDYFGLWSYEGKLYRLVFWFDS